MYYRIHSTATDVWALTATKALMPVALTSVALVGEDLATLDLPASTSQA